MKKSRANKGSKSVFKAILLGTLLIWSVFFATSLLFAVILFSGENPTASTSLFSLIAFLISGAAGTLLNKILLKSCKLNAPLVSALLSAGIYIAISTVASGKISTACLINAFCFTVIALLFSLAKPKRKRVKRHSR